MADETPRRLAHDVDVVSEQKGFIDVMSHEENRRPMLAPNVKQKSVHRQTRLGIERAERLIHQQHLRAEDEGSGNRDPLFHAARKLLRIFVRSVR